MDIFEMLYEEHYKKLYTLAFRMSGKKEDAEDILQSAFLSAFKAFDNFRNDSSFYTWMYKIVVYEARNRNPKSKIMPAEKYAKEKGISINDVFKHINSFGEVEDEVISNIVRETCLQLVMDCMSPKLRAVFTLRIILNLSVKDTSEILEITENSVKVYLHRARSLMKDIMNGRCSLINPKNPCKCSAWVKYAIDSKRDILNKDLMEIHRHEKNNAIKFKAEVKEILSIWDLYRTEIVSGDCSGFIDRMKGLIRQQKFKLLEID